jgi:hypothetical protein
MNSPKVYSPQRRRDAEKHIRKEGEVKTGERRGGRGRRVPAVAVGASAQVRTVLARCGERPGSFDSGKPSLWSVGPLPPQRPLIFGFDFSQRLCSEYTFAAIARQGGSMNSPKAYSPRRRRDAEEHIREEVKTGERRGGRGRGALAVAVGAFAQDLPPAGELALCTARTLRFWSPGPLRPLPPQRPPSFEFGFSQRLSASAVNALSRRAKSPCLCVQMVIS